MEETQKNQMEFRLNHLEEIKGELKTTFFGIDGQIDRIVDSLKAWYVMPDIMTQPLIINLWSMTGNGKTALVRELVRKLKFGDRYCEVQMTDKTLVSSTTQAKDLVGMLLSSGCRTNEPGILFLDEFQRYRTIASSGAEVSDMKNQDIWMMLSDGKFPRNTTQRDKDLSIIQRRLFFEWMEEKITSPKGEVCDKYVYRKKANWDQQVFGREYDYDSSHITELIVSVMDYSVSGRSLIGRNYADVWEMMENHVEASGPTYDFTKCVVIVAGNLDEAYQVADDVGDCDTNADIFHAHTKKISIMDMKKAMAIRWKPEQIARLGNNHIIYPSLNKEAYEKIIHANCEKSLDKLFRKTGIRFRIGSNVVKEIYDNSVYPTQGTRPVFSTIHKMFGSPMSNGVLWALRNDIEEGMLDISTKDSCLRFSSGNLVFDYPIDFDIRDQKARYSIDYTALLAVHEMGHAILYADLFKTAPTEIKINVASFTGGYNKFHSPHQNKGDMLNMICIAYGGIVAEEIVFGSDMRSTGSAGDIVRATDWAAKYVRKYAMNGMESHHCQNPVVDSAYTSFEESNEHIENILKEQKKRAHDLLQNRLNFLVKSAHHLLDVKKFSAEEFVEYAKDEFTLVTADASVDIRGNYMEKLENVLKRNS